MVGERRGSIFGFFREFIIVFEELFWTVVVKDKSFYFKGGNFICSFVDIGVFSGDLRF